MDMSALNTTLLDIREGLITSPFLQNMEKSYSRLQLDKPENKVITRNFLTKNTLLQKVLGCLMIQNHQKKLLIILLIKDLLLWRLLV